MAGAKAKKAGRAHKGQVRKFVPKVKKPKGGY